MLQSGQHLLRTISRRASKYKVVATYIDDGISGKNDFTRPQYNEMLQQLSEDGFDLIITKALSRLNRDELNSLMLNSLLIEHEATVLTLEDYQIHDFEDMNSGLLHSIKYAMDAQFVKQQSINGRKTQELRCEKKELSAKDCSYGYDWHREDKTITINEDQAEVVRRFLKTMYTATALLLPFKEH
jgi:site-specific DNA recombinase